MDEIIASLEAATAVINFISNCFGLLVALFSVVCMWKIHEKMGEEGWTAIISFYNNWILCKHTWGKGVMMLFFFIPIVGIFLQQMTNWRMFKGFKQSTLMCVLGMAIPAVTLAICAFGDAQYEDQIDDEIVAKL